MIDSHCHIAGPEFAQDLDEVVARARDAGLSGALVVLAADDGEELKQASEVAARWPQVRFTIGVHPHAAGAKGGNQDMNRTQGGSTPSYIWPWMRMVCRSESLLRKVPQRIVHKLVA